MVADPRDVEYMLCGWRVQPLLNRLTNNGVEFRLEPRVMQVLVCLLAADGEPVTRDALMQQVWGHEYVTEDALNRTVSKLRRFIIDDLKCDTEIETIPKTGYRLLQTSDEPASPKRLHGINLRRHWWWIFALVPIVALIMVFWPYKVQERPQSVTTNTGAMLSPLTSLEGTEIDPTLSPDGSHVAFGWRKRPSEKYHIYVRPLASEALLQLTHGSDDDFRPKWSPDGTQIAFARTNGERCEVLSVSPVGGPTRRLADCDKSDGDNIAWSPDNSALAFKAPGSRGLDLLTLATGHIRHLTEVPPTDKQDSSPAFSPDGTLLAFVRWHASGVSNLYVVPVSGGEPRRITFDNLKVEGITWEPDNRHIVFSSNRGGPFALWRTDIDGNPAERVPVSGRSAFTPVLSKDGRHLVYEEWTGQTNIFSVDTHDLAAAPRQITQTTLWDWNPAGSPNGKRLAFTSDRSGSFEIWVSNTDGSAPLKLTAFGGPYTSDPTWSPDTRHIVFDSPAVNGNFDIYLVDAEGGAPRRLTTDPAQDRFPHYSFDGKWIYFSSRRSGAWEIWRMPASGGKAEQATFNGAYFSRPGPNGSVYFTRDRDPGIWQIVPGSDPVLVVQDIEAEDSNCWLVDTNTIWYIRRKRGQPRYLASHPLAPGGPGKELVALPNLSYRSGLGLTADGRILFSSVVRDESDLVLVEQ